MEPKGEKRSNRLKINANEVLEPEDYREIRRFLSDCLEMPLEELVEREKALKIEKILQIFENATPEDVDPGNCYIAKEMKERYEEVALDEANNYSTDLLSEEELKTLDRKHRMIGIGKKIFDQFYNLKWKNPYRYHSTKEVDMDFTHLGRIKDHLDFGDEKEGGGYGKLFEKCFPAGIVLNGWLGKGSKFKPESAPKVGKMMHTLEYDDVINHADYYTEMVIAGEKIPVAFDTTTNSSENKILSKLETMSRDNPETEKSFVPFGFTQIKYCVFNEKPESRRMPLFKIAVEYDPEFRISDSVYTYGKKETKQSLEILKRGNNEVLLSKEDMERAKVLLSKPKESLSSKENQFLKIINMRADNFSSLKNAFFISSEVFEQSELILEKDKEERKKKIRVRNVLTDEERANVEKIRNQMWESLKVTMGRLILANGEKDEFKGYSDWRIYERLKEFAGVYEDMKDEEIMMSKGHFFGLREVEDGNAFCDMCYVNMMRMIQLEKGEGTRDGKPEIFYKKYKVVERNGKKTVKTVVGRIKEELNDSEKPSEEAKQIFSKMTTDSYKENFEDLIEVAQETGTMKVFLDRMKMGDFDPEKRILEGGYDRNREGELGRVEKAENAGFDDLVERLFVGEEFSELRAKYLQGKRLNQLADCFSDEFLSKEGNWLKLIDWGVSEGRVANFIAKVKGIPESEAKKELTLLLREKKP